MFGNFLVGLFLGALFTIAAFGLVIGTQEDARANAGYYTYPEQRQDRKSCEEVIPRNKRCVLSTLWLPEAEDMPNEHLHQ